MKTRTSMISLLCIAALLLSLSGCATLNSYLGGYFAESKEAVLLRLTQYVDGRQPTSANLSMDMTITSLQNGEPACINVSLEHHAQIASETDSYGESTLSYSVNDLETTDSTQVYNFAEDGKLLTFTHVDSTDRWFRSKAPLPEQQPEPTPAPIPAPAEGEEATEPEVTISEAYGFLLLEEGTQTIDDQTVYVLSGSIDGEDCAALLQNAPLLDALTARLLSASAKGTNPSAINLKAPDYSKLTADVLLYLNKESCAPVQIDLTLSGMNLLIAEFMKLLPEQAAAFLGSSVTIEPIRITLSDISFDPVTIPEVTEEARILAMQESLDPDQGDGTYVLQQHGDSIKITAQTGWTVSELGYCFAGFHNPDRTRSVFYELYPNTTAEEFIAQVEDGMIPAMEAHELTVTTASGEPIGDYQTHVIKGDALNVYLAYRTVGNSLLGIYAEDSSGANLTAVLTPLLDSVADHQIEY